MNIFAAEFEAFGDRLEELIAQVASEKMQLVLEDLAEDHIPDVVEQKIEKAFDEMDLAGHILLKIAGVDLQTIVRKEVERIVIQLLEQQLGDMIREQVRLVLSSDEVRKLISTLIAVRSKSLLESPEVTRKLDELAKERISSTLQKWTSALLQDRGDGSIPSSQ
jgi:hypothetical protein